ncbi:YkgJ family cysteine cluster protein [Helicobacter trogontum]|uniref:YkgJ family cysteine cluster protein n=1 Tax=Helicobacter trogontum TaxID=50960 RepID=A0A4U8SBF8_9HELI|nr:YkgJ family cysteine cluster protein [Helicobacter trogontum]MCI5786242.1 YkgJ family cysteine cluster protein [Helicobacter trogontum]MDY5185917.1 YkgJ family cysteine cluster protein [Helicobacter trogontum]TLD83390.1 YkgJ family cysteine cluster protein [Helicobacter trogontum]
MKDKVDSNNCVQDNIIRKENFDFVFNAGKCGECGGKCCYGESGYIFVSIAEMEQISAFLEIPFEDFCLRYVKKVGTRFSFIEKKCEDEEKGVSCIFFDEKSLKCSVYEVRPKQCQTFPFWDMYKNNKDELVGRCIGVVL